jgi:hypothetical protein
VFDDARLLIRGKGRWGIEEGGAFGGRQRGGRVAPAFQFLGGQRSSSQHLDDVLVEAFLKTGLADDGGDLRIGLPGGKGFATARARSPTVSAPATNTAGSTQTARRIWVYRELTPLRRPRFPRPSGML